MPLKGWSPTKENKRLKKQTLSVKRQVSSLGWLGLGGNKSQEQPAFWKILKNVERKFKIFQTQKIPKKVFEKY